jgi:mRNA-degrading endonuclease RelE of RelBE toxin-antitoxin system
MFEIIFGEEFVANLKKLRASKRQEILDRIGEQLTYQPNVATRNKKILGGLRLPWEHERPIWELRVGEYRVFYDADTEQNRVMVHALRHKPPHLTTEEIL